MQADLCLASHRRDTSLSLTGIGEESCPHLPVGYHNQHTASVCAQMSVDWGGRQEMCRERKTAIEREREGDNGDD